MIKTTPQPSPTISRAILTASLTAAILLAGFDRSRAAGPPVVAAAAAKGAAAKGTGAAAGKGAGAAGGAVDPEALAKQGDAELERVNKRWDAWIKYMTDINKLVKEGQDPNFQTPKQRLDDLNQMDKDLGELKEPRAIRPIDPTLSTDLSHDLQELRAATSTASRGVNSRDGSPAETVPVRSPKRAVDAAQLLRGRASATPVLFASPQSATPAEPGRPQTGTSPRVR